MRGGEYPRLEQARWRGSRSPRSRPGSSPSRRRRRRAPRRGRPRRSRPFARIRRRLIVIIGPPVRSPNSGYDLARKEMRGGARTIKGPTTKDGRKIPKGPRRPRPWRGRAPSRGSLGTPSASPLPLLSFEGFTVDLARRLLQRGSDDVRLRPQTFDVLAVLAQAPNRVVSKETLFASVWGSIRVTDDSLVQCIHELRTALRDPGQRLIRTVPRRGYCWRGRDPCESASARSTAASRERADGPPRPSPSPRRLSPPSRRGARCTCPPRKPPRRSPCSRSGRSRDSRGRRHPGSGHRGRAHPEALGGHAPCRAADERRAPDRSRGRGARVGQAPRRGLRHRWAPPTLRARCGSPRSCSRSRPARCSGAIASRSRRLTCSACRTRSPNGQRPRCSGRYRATSGSCSRGVTPPSPRRAWRTSAADTSGRAGRSRRWRRASSSSSARSTSTLATPWRRRGSRTRTTCSARTDRECHAPRSSAR